MILASDQLQAQANTVVERVVDEMYRNPFWDGRFGRRGREFAIADNHHHINYVVQALRAGAPDLLVGYAQWLRTVLTTRGMCTRHLAENFTLLAAAMPSDAAPASEYLEHARAALTYATGPQRSLQLRADEIASAAADMLSAEYPEWLARFGAAARMGWVDVLQYHLSYLADALELERNDVFVEYVDWTAGFDERRGIERVQTRAALNALWQALDVLQVDGREAVQRVLEMAAVRVGEVV